MFGRIRASSCPADSLERPPSKILKDDSFSIYEATLIKLKLGSKRNLSPCSNELGKIDADSNSGSPESEPMNIEVNCASLGTFPYLVASCPQEEVMKLDTDCSSERSSITSRDCNSTGTSKQPRSRDVSVLYLFSKFKSTHDANNSSSGDSMTIDSVGVSASSSGSQSVNSTEQQSEQECISSLPSTGIDML